MQKAIQGAHRNRTEKITVLKVDRSDTFGTYKALFIFKKSIVYSKDSIYAIFRCSDLADTWF